MAQPSGGLSLGAGFGAGLGDMARAVGELVAAKERHLHELEAMTYRQGVEPGPDLAFAGVRLVVARGRDAQRLLAALARDEAAFRAWWTGRAAAPPGEQAAPSPARV